jgi:hypothetical protein
MQREQKLDHQDAGSVSVTQCSGSATFWYRSSDLYLLLTDPDLDPTLFVSDLQNANKNIFFFGFYFLKVPYIYIIL